MKENGERINSSGHAEVITGSMFSGKTDELIRRLRRVVVAKQKVQVFKPGIDNRYAVDKVASHAGQQYGAELVDNASEILGLLKEDTVVVAIDEAQFFDEDVVNVVDSLASEGLRVIVAGLDTDFRGEPFGSMPTLIAKAETVLKLNAICMVCHGEASRTQRLVDGQPAHYDDPIQIVGADELYEARCRTHHEVRRD